MRTQGNIVIGNLQQTSCYLTDTGVVDAYFVSFLPPITGYTDGLEVTFKAINSNTGPCTLEVDGYGAVPIVKEAIQALSVGDILAGEIVNLIYDGTYFQMIATPQVNATPFGTFRIDGGEIIWVANLNYSVSAANYVILGLPYSSDLTAITLAAADPTFDRIDLVVADTSDNVVVITGSATSDPQEPSYDPATQIPLSFINVAAGSTSPSCALLTTVYKENLGGPTEWAAVSSSGSVVVNSTSNPRTGTKDIEGTAVPAATTVTFTAPAAFDITNTTQLDLYIRSKGSWGTTANGHRISVTFNIASGQIGVPVIIPPRTAFGFDSSTVGSYQQIAIDRALFNIPDGAMITSIVFTIGGVDGSMGFYIDDVSLEQNCILPVTLFNNGLTKTANTVQLGGTLIKNTLNHTASFIHTLQGATVFNYPYQFSQIQAFQNSTSIASFLSRGSNVPTAPDFNNLVRLGINYTGSQYDDSPAIIGYLNDKNAYLISTNIKGHASFGLDTDNSAAKITAIALHTFDSGYTDAITFIGKQPPNVNQAIGILSGTALEPYRIATMHTDGAFTLWKYGVGTFIDTPIYALGVTASGDIIEFSPSGGTPLRFGVAGEDDTAGESRIFSAGNFPVEIDFTSGSFTLSKVLGTAGTAFATIYQTTTDAGTSSSVGLIVTNASNRISGFLTNRGIVSHTELNTGPGGGPAHNFYCDPVGAGNYGLVVSGSGSATGVYSQTDGTGSGDTAVAGIFVSTGHVALKAYSDVIPFNVFNYKSDNSIQTIIRLERQGSFPASNGVGGTLDYIMSTDVDVQHTMIQEQVSMTDVTDASYTAEYKLRVAGNAVLNDLVTASGIGAMQFNQYGSGTFTGTDTYWLAVDSSGNIIEKAIPGGTPSKFGKSGEDDTAGENRSFNTGTYDFTITGSKVGTILNNSTGNSVLYAQEGNYISRVDMVGNAGTTQAQVSISALVVGGDFVGVTLNAVPGQLILRTGSSPISLTNYGSGTYTGTPTKNLSVDSSGNVIETNLSSIAPAIYSGQFWCVGGGGLEFQLSEVTNTTTAASFPTFVQVNPGQYSIQFSSAILTAGKVFVSVQDVYSSVPAYSYSVINISGDDFQSTDDTLYIYITDYTGAPSDNATFLIKIEIYP